MDQVTKGIKDLVLAGIGAAATTAEKADEMMKEMIKKGEATVEQGKTINEELKHTLKNTVASKASSLIDKAEDLTDEELATLKQRIEDIQKQRADKQD